MAKLIAQSGHSLDLPQRRITLGESPACDIPLATGMGLAAVHFEMVPDEAGNWLVRDMSGGQGLLINGAQVSERVLTHGNVIMAGALQLGFWNADAPSVQGVSPFLASPAAAAPTAPAVVNMPPAPAVTAPAPVSAPEIPAPALFRPAEVQSSTAETAAHVAAAFAPSPSPGLALTGGAMPSLLNHAVAGLAPSSAPLTEEVPPPVLPKVATPALDGPPIAWANLREEKAAVPAISPPAPTAYDPSNPPPPPPEMPMLKVRRWRGFRPGIISRLPRPLVALLAVAITGGIGFGALKIPAVAAVVQPLWAKFQAWTNPEKPGKAVAGNTQTTPGESKTAASPLAEDLGVTPRAPHGDVVKIFLNERVTNLFQADLRQLIPFYNASAAARNLPPQKEMTEAFRKHYGVLLDGFDRLSCVRAPGRDEFVFVLSGSNRIDLEGMIGLPPVQNQPKTTKPGSPKTIRVYPVKTAGRVYGIAQYDPFTVVLGNATWIDSALNGSSVALREALCMFPESANRQPGALIMVERLPTASPDSGLLTPFQVSISNLFLKDAGESRLILTRNPEVKEEIFVEQSSAALKVQAQSMFQSLRVASPTVRAASAAPDVNAVDPYERITTAEASIKIPDGDALIREALDSVARTFTSQSPSMDLILAAQTAVMRFNQARLQGSTDAAGATSVAEAMELLQNGIVIHGSGNARDIEIRIERLEPEQIDTVSRLLTLDTRVGLVFRPDKDALSGTLLELALKARDYRNAELLISLWAAAKFSSSDAADTRSAVRRVLDWANKEGHRKRVSVGLPMLTDAELNGASDMLSYEAGTLKWKAGAEDYRTWLRKVHPDPKTDAKRIAAAFTQAKNAGAVPIGKVSELSDAIHFINKGVRTGTSNTLIHAGGLSTDELRAAARYLQWDGGSLRVVDR